MVGPRPKFSSPEYPAIELMKIHIPYWASPSTPNTNGIRIRPTASPIVWSPHVASRLIVTRLRNPMLSSEMHLCENGGVIPQAMYEIRNNPQSSEVPKPHRACLGGNRAFALPPLAPEMPHHVVQKP